jgi:hypothetical protein
MMTELGNILCSEAYNKFSSAEPILFYNLFYSYKPYYGAEGGAVEYSLLNHEDKLYKNGLIYKGGQLISQGTEPIPLSVFEQPRLNMALDSNYIFSNIESLNLK